MKRKISIGFGVSLVLLIGILIGKETLLGDLKENLLDNNSKVTFEDDEMAKVIAEFAGVNVSKIREEDLEKVEVLNIGYTGYYDTLVDIEKCPNLKRLMVGYPEEAFDKYPFKSKPIPKPETEEKIYQIENELEGILEKCPNLTTIYLSNEKGNCELKDLEFLKKGKNLEVINLFYQSEIDYSAISECTKLQCLTLFYCDVSDLEMIGKLEKLECMDLRGTNVLEATDILKLKKLSFFMITDTPLAEKEEQLELIQNKFPELEIEKDY